MLCKMFGHMRLEHIFELLHLLSVIAFLNNLVYLLAVLAVGLRHALVVALFFIFVFREF